ncbi:MAG: hypothetical protein M0017_04500 [Desulfobacteraceae bacterium]|nr:hypothetical protein [Desulfobacteraceae bacterium]
MEEIALLTPLYGGIYHDRLEEGWGLQWPCPDRSHPGTPFLHKGAFTRGRGRFVPTVHVPPAEQPDGDFPFTLITGRVYHHYHTGTMTRRCAALDRECREAVLEMNGGDAAALAIRAGERVRLVSRRGSLTLRAAVTGRMGPGQVYTSFHFTEAAVNRLLGAARDPSSHCPEYKVCAVRVEKVA